MTSLPGIVFIKNHQSQYVWCNENFANMINIDSCANIHNKSDFDLILDNSFLEQSVLDDQKVICTGNIINNLYKINKEGNETYLQIEKAPLYDETKKIVGILATGIDITEQKKQALKQKEEYQFIQDILYNLPGLIYWKDLDLRYMIFNKNVVQLSGLSKEELLGKNDLELNWGVREAESFRRDDREIIKTGISKTTEYEVPIKRSDDHYMIVRTVKSPLFDKNGKITGVLAVAMDITDQKILEKNLTQARDRIEKLDQIKTDFIRNMEHDIRTPFTGLKTLSSILEEQEDDEEKKVLISAIHQSAKELLDYCNTILDFSKIESGSLPVLEKKFDMKELIHHIISLEKAALEEKKHKVRVNYEENLPCIFIGDPYRIERILVNLVSNAIKFSQDGEIIISVILAKVKNNHEYLIKLSVKDEGIGIAEDKISQIYEKFTRLSLSNQGQYKGMGLGLSIVKNLLLDLEGEIDVESQLGKGSTFVCTFILKVPLEHSL